MSISPAMLNRAKKIPVRPVVAHFMGQEYTTYIPAKPIITVEQFLTSFAQDNLKGKFNYTDLEMVKNKEWISYDNTIQTEDSNNRYNIFLSEFNQKTFYEKRDKLDWERPEEVFHLEQGFLYDHEEVDSSNRPIKHKNFFYHLLKVFPQFSLNGWAKENNKINNMFNLEAAQKALEENRKKYSNPWLYNEQTFPSIVTPLNVQQWDPFYYKNMLTQLIAPIAAKNKNVSIDVDTVIKSRHTKEKQVDLMIRNSDIDSNIPLNIIDKIDEIALFNSIRNEIYDYIIPKDYPTFLYETINPKNPQELIPSVVQILNIINKKYGDIIKKRYEEMLIRILEERAFKSYDTLRTLSRSRYAMLNKVHIGISAFNDKIRFNLYHRPAHHLLENLEDLHRSPVFDLQITPGTNEIKNIYDYQEFVNILNTVMNLSPAVLDILFEDFQMEKTFGATKGLISKRLYNNSLKDMIKDLEKHNSQQLTNNH